MKHLLFLLLCCLAANARSDGLPSGQFIYAVGKAQRSVDADIATLTIIVSSAHEDQAVARTKVATDARSVFAVLESSGVSDGDISSHQVSADAEYDYQNRTRKLTGYRVTQIVVATFRNVSRVAETASRLMSGDIIKVEVTSVRSTKQDEIERELTAIALKDARRRADDIARETGLRVVSVHAVSPVGFTDLRERFLGREEKGMKTFGADSGGLKIHIPKVEVEAKAHVLFNAENA
jgi:uncharacterized protein YggE